MTGTTPAEENPRPAGPSDPAGAPKTPIPTAQSAGAAGASNTPPPSPQPGSIAEAEDILAALRAKDVPELSGDEGEPQGANNGSTPEVEDPNLAAIAANQAYEVGLEDTLVCIDARLWELEVMGADPTRLLHDEAGLSAALDAAQKVVDEYQVFLNNLGIPRLLSLRAEDNLATLRKEMVSLERTREEMLAERRARQALLASSSQPATTPSAQRQRLKSTVFVPTPGVPTPTPTPPAAPSTTIGAYVPPSPVSFGGWAQKEPAPEVSK
jgi:hypothetical protein